MSTSLLLTIALSACSNSNTSAANRPDRGDSPAVKIVASDIKLDKKEYRAIAGEVHLRYVDEGAMPHTLRIEGNDDFKMSVESYSDVDEGTVDLKPGQHTIYCDVSGHREAGMHAVLNVAPAPTTASTPTTASAHTAPTAPTTTPDGDATPDD